MKKQNKAKYNNTVFFLLQRSVYKKMSQEYYSFQWTEELIDKFQNKIDWENLSENSEVAWSTSILEKYKSKLDWERLSANHNAEKYDNAKIDNDEKFLKDRVRPELFSLENLKKFEEYWNWNLLSDNTFVYWTDEEIEIFKDRLDWNKLIHHLYRKDFQFYEKYQEYIPHPEMFDSVFWRSMVKHEMFKFKRNNF